MATALQGRRAALWSGWLIVAGCASGPDLIPAREAQALTGEVGEGAYAEVSGVRVEVATGAWRGFPEEIDAVEPLRLVLQNQSGRSIQVRLEDFALEGLGVRLVALPPLLIEGRETVAVRTYAPTFAHRHFFLAPGYRLHYPGMRWWGGPGLWAPTYYQTYYSYWPVELPTTDMIARALPEGVVEDGGRLAGFLYFQQVPSGLQTLTFVARLSTPEGEAIGDVRIPFSRRR